MSEVEDTIEIGAISGEEADAFLRVMCGAFDMKFDAARPIFQSDPYFDLRNKMALRLNGEIVCCLTVVERTCWIGAAQVNVAGIAGVSTVKAQRRRGFAGRLLTDTLQMLHRRRFDLTMLFPVDPAYYLRFGWESSGTGVTSRRLSPGPSLPDETARVRPATGDDIGPISAIYDAESRCRTLHCLRDEKRWRYLLGYLPFSCVAEGRDGKIEGYVLFDFQGRAPSSADRPHGGVRVLEMAATGLEAHAALRAHLYAQAGDGAVEFTELRETLQLNGFEPPYEASPGVMARVLAWPELLTALSINWPPLGEPVGLVLVDPLISERPSAVLIQSLDGLNSVRGVDPMDLESLCGDFVVGEVNVWSPVVTGHISAEAALGAGGLKASTPRAVGSVSELFPARAPFVPTADHF